MVLNKNNNFKKEEKEKKEKIEETIIYKNPNDLEGKDNKNVIQNKKKKTFQQFEED